MLCFAAEIHILRIQCWDYTKRNTKTDSTAVRGHDTYMCHQNPRTWHILDWKTNCKTCLETFMIVFFLQIFVFSYAENSTVQNIPKLYEQTGLPSCPSQGHWPMGAIPGLTIGWAPSPPTIPPGVSNRRRWLDAYICLQSSILANITCINCDIHWSKEL